jgi:hypothetical protein
MNELTPIEIRRRNFERRARIHQAAQDCVRLGETLHQLEWEVKLLDVVDDFHAISSLKHRHEKIVEIIEEIANRWPPVERIRRCDSEQDSSESRLG